MRPELRLLFGTVQRIPYTSGVGSSYLSLNRAAMGYVGAFGAVCIVTAVIALLNQVERISNISMLYLLAVIVSAVAFGQGQAVFASIASFLTYDLFFIQPLYTFTVSEMSEWLALFLLLIIGIITGQLAARQRKRAIESEQRERETAVLYDIASLMGNVDSQAALQAVAARLQTELSLAAIGIALQEDAASIASIELGSGEALSALRSANVTPSQLLLGGASPTATSRGGQGRWIRTIPSKGALLRRSYPGAEIVPIKAGGKRIGNLVVVRGKDHASLLNETRLLSAVAAQISAAVELDRLRGEATEAEALRRTDELKTTLLNAVSHDLRTPLASIIAAAGSLQQTDVIWTDAEQHEFADAIETEAQRLNRLVGNLLDLSRIESGILQPDKGWYDLAALIDEVLGRLRPVLAGHPLKIDVPADLSPMELDYIEIDEVLSNLLENAVKYTPTGSEIELNVRRQTNGIVVTVADRGPGIPEAVISRVFEAFYRLPGSKAKGTGLGLAVAKGLVEAHGGRMWVHNRQGGGAAFSFLLPMDQAGRRMD